MTEPALKPVETTPEPEPEPVADEIPVIECEPDEELKPFRLVYSLHGQRVEELLHYRARGAPFSIFARINELRIASTTNVPERINEAIRRVILVAMPEEDSARFLSLIEGDADEVGVVPAKSIGAVMDLIRTAYYGKSSVPTRAGSQSGQQRTRRTSSAGRSGKGSRSTTSKRKKV